MSNQCALKAFLELKSSLLSFLMKAFHLLMHRLGTHAAISHGWRITANDCTNHIAVGIFGTVVMLIAFKWYLAVMNHTAWTANCNSIDNNYPDPFSILVDT